MTDINMLIPNTMITRSHFNM